jgi:predicted enzyme related to lactoylglutathione lyase
VDDLDTVLEHLRAEGVTQHGDIVTLPFGRFAKIIDPEGNPIELWEPAPGF